MQKLLWKHGLLAGVSVFAIALVSPIAVHAVPARAEEARTTAQENASEAGDDTVRTLGAEKKEEAKTRLANAKLKACQNREKAVQNIMVRIADRGQKQLDLFTTISERTQKFYTDKGRTASNYDTLVADVNAKKTAAQATVDEIKAKSVTFKCDGEDPKGVASSFKDSLKSEIEALKAYKTSVKNLIVGVKSAQATDTKTEDGDQ